MAPSQAASQNAISLLVHPLSLPFSPSQMDVFSDGTPCEGDPDEVEVQFSGKAISQRHVSSNPHAGEVRRVEAASGVWMTKAKTEIETENAKAREQADQKRLIGLAKQTQIGLANIGVKYEMVSKDSNTTPFFTTANPHFLFNHLAPCTRQTSIANILRLAFRCDGKGQEGGSFFAHRRNLVNRGALKHSFKF